MKKIISLVLMIFLFSIISVNAQKQSAKMPSPKTVRDYFMLLPDNYFQALCCGDDTKESYLKMFLDVEDTKNGYMRGNAEGGQSGFEMALFKRPNGSYIVGLYTFGEMWDDFYFLEYTGGKWFDVSKKVIPDYGKYRWYELPRYGTTIKVYRKQFVEDDGEITFGTPEEKLYDLQWKDGKFIKK